MEYNGLDWAWLENMGNNLFGSMACWFQFLGWATLTWGFINVCVCIKVKWFGLCTFRSGPFIELGSDWAKAFGNWLRILHEMGLSEPGRFFSGLDWPTHQINRLQMIYSSQSGFLFKSKSSIAKLLKLPKEERGGPWKPIFKIVR